ncbi:MAG: TIGR01906 family membrane protein [Chloroflexota bacterium]
MSPARRENPADKRPWWAPVLVAIVVILIPPTLVLTNVRLLMTPAFLQIEYRLPGFPDDPYGFTRQDRLRWAPIALEYLLNDAGREFLGDLRFDDGSPVYNERELRHMDDVKRLAQAALRFWLASLLVIAVSLLLTRGVGAIGVWRALAGGGQLTLALMLALALGLAFSFSSVFVGFHRVFFEGDTWLFRYSDTLIRLFPERFWRDAFVFIAAATFAEAAGLWTLARCLSRRAATRTG